MILVKSSAAAGLLVATFGIAGGLVALLALFGKGSFVRLTSDGFTVGLMFRAPRTTSWSEVASFSPEQIASATLVVVHRANGRSWLLPDTYGFRPARLAEMLNGWKDRYAPSPAATWARDPAPSRAATRRSHSPGAK